MISTFFLSLVERSLIRKIASQDIQPVIDENRGMVMYPVILGGGLFILGARLNNGSLKSRDLEVNYKNEQYLLPTDEVFFLYMGDDEIPDKPSPANTIMTNWCLMVLSDAILGKAHRAVRHRVLGKKGRELHEDIISTLHLSVM